MRYFSENFRTLGKILLVMYVVSALLLFLLAFWYRNYSGVITSFLQELL